MIPQEGDSVIHGPRLTSKEWMILAIFFLGYLVVLSGAVTLVGTFFVNVLIAILSSESETSPRPGSVHGNHWISAGEIFGASLPYLLLVVATYTGILVLSSRTGGGFRIRLAKSCVLAVAGALVVGQLVDKHAGVLMLMAPLLPLADLATRTYRLPGRGVCQLILTGLFILALSINPRILLHAAGYSLLTTWLPHIPFVFLWTRLLVPESPPIPPTPPQGAQT